MAEAEPEQIANQIRTFAETIDNPDGWKVVVPREKYSDVVDLLATTKEISRYYRGVTLCYGDGYDETQVKLRTDLSAYLDTLNSLNGGDSDTD